MAANNRETICKIQIHKRNKKKKKNKIDVCIFITTSPAPSCLLLRVVSVAVELPRFIPDDLIDLCVTFPLQECITSTPTRAAPRTLCWPTAASPPLPNRRAFILETLRYEDTAGILLLWIDSVILFRWFGPDSYSISSEMAQYLIH